MTEQEYTAAKATLAHAETEIAGLTQQVRDSIEKAREYNAITKTLQNQITTINRQLAPLREAVVAHEVEAKRILSEQRKAEAEAALKAAAEAQAKEQTELQKKDAEIAALKEQLAAKG